MTDREKAVVMAYTGVVMLAGDKLKVFYDYVSEKIGRPVFTHELPTLHDAIKEAAFPDFCIVCGTETEPEKCARWEYMGTFDGHNHFECTSCGKHLAFPVGLKPFDANHRFCGRCGANMIGGVSDG